MKKVGTLKELDLKPGDVVECVGNTMAKGSLSEGNHYTIGMSRLPIDNCGEEYPWSCAEFRIVSRASDKPKLWRDMTDAEKGALLLAHHEGKVIEGRNESWPNDGWIEIRVPSWWNDSAYRVRPEPKVDTVKQGYKTNSSGKFVTTSALDHATHVVTFNMIDGKPDYASIKMESLE